MYPAVQRHLIIAGGFLDLPSSTAFLMMVGYQTCGDIRTGRPVAFSSWDCRFASFCLAAILASASLSPPPGLRPPSAGLRPPPAWPQTKVASNGASKGTS